VGRTLAGVFDAGPISTEGFVASLPLTEPASDFRSPHARKVYDDEALVARYSGPSLDRLPATRAACPPYAPPGMHKRASRIDSI